MLYGCWERFCFCLLPRSANLLEPRDDYTTTGPGVERPRDYCGWRVEDVAISMWGEHRSRAAMVFFQAYPDSSTSFCIFVFCSKSIDSYMIVAHFLK